MILIVICNVRWAAPCFAACLESCQSDLQHVNSSISPKIHVSKWPVNWVKNRVNFIDTYIVSDMNKTHRQIKFEWIVIVASIDICVYFTSSKCIVLLVLMCI